MLMETVTKPFVNLFRRGNMLMLPCSKVILEVRGFHFSALKNADSDLHFSIFSPYLTKSASANVTRLIKTNFSRAASRANISLRFAATGAGAECLF